MAQVADKVSRQIVAQADRRRPRHGAQDEEARAFLQLRLNVYAKTLFWSFVALITFLYLAYRFVLGDQRPRYTAEVLGGGFVLLAIMAVIWRVVLARGDRDSRTLYRLDVLFATAIGLAFGASATLQYDVRAAGYTSLIFASFTVFTRALLVPSSQRRTVVTSIATFAPLLGSSVILALEHHAELPGPALVGGAAMFCIIATLIAANGSTIIYGLRRDITKAMRLGQYTLEAKIGEGGIGKVYRASHAMLRRPTAIKLLQRTSAADLERFEREVQLTSTLTHPNTVAIYDYGTSANGVFYYAMEYLDGIDLQKLVVRFGKQREGRVVQILVQVCSALKEAHARNLVHRDIKPANIILCERGGMPDVAKVVDFGLVKDVTRDLEQTGSTTILGTPLYMAPEMVSDLDASSPAADLYAVGCVGYFLLTGRPPFEAKSQIEIAVQHVTKQAVRPGSIPGVTITPALDAVIMQCLAKAPGERPDSAAVLIEQLAALPSLRDWTVADAELWWREFRAEPAEPDPTALDTVTVDVAQRELDKRST